MDAAGRDRGLEFRPATGGDEGAVIAACPAASVGGVGRAGAEEALGGGARVSLFLRAPGLLIILLVPDVVALFFFKGSPIHSTAHLSGALFGALYYAWGREAWAALRHALGNQRVFVTARPVVKDGETVRDVRVRFDGL